MTEPVWALDEPDDEWYESETPQDVSRNECEDQLDHIKRIQWELQRDLEHVDRQREKIDRFEDARKESAKKRIMKHHAHIWRHMEARGETSMNLINGKIRTRIGSMSVKVLDEKEIPQEFFKPGKPKVSRTLIANHIKTTGEIPEGVDWERGDDSFKVTLFENPELTAGQKKEIEDNDINF